MMFIGGAGSVLVMLMMLVFWAVTSINKISRPESGDLGV
jgi:hypothetical protein